MFEAFSPRVPHLESLKPDARSASAFSPIASKLVTEVHSGGPQADRGFNKKHAFVQKRAGTSVKSHGLRACAAPHFIQSPSYKVYAGTLKSESPQMIPQGAAGTSLALLVSGAVGTGVLALPYGA